MYKIGSLLSQEQFGGVIKGFWEVVAAAASIYIFKVKLLRIDIFSIK